MPPQEEHNWGDTVDLSKKYVHEESPEPVSRIYPQRGSGNSMITSFVIRYLRFIKDEKRARYVLLVFIVLMTTISIFLLFDSNRTTSSYDPVPVIGREFEDVNWPPTK